MLPVVFVDADVLYSPTLRGWLFNIVDSPSPPFALAVSEDVIAEAVARYRDRNPRARGVVTSKMSQHIRELCMVVEDFDCDIAFPGDDEGDIHVHAAALAAGAGYLITRDSGFQELGDDVKDSLPYEIYDPDDFFLLANDQSQSRVREAARAQMRHHAKKKPRQDEPSITDRLERAGCPKFAQVVDAHFKVLAGLGAP